MNTILLDKNGIMSSGHRTHHINIRYFFVYDRIKAGKMIVWYCLMGNMIADFLTKPLKGKLFQTFRNLI